MPTKQLKQVSNVDDVQLPLQTKARCRAFELWAANEADHGQLVAVSAWGIMQLARISPVAASEIALSFCSALATGGTLIPEQVTASYVRARKAMMCKPKSRRRS